VNANIKSEEEVLELYERIIRTSNHFLYNCTNFSISVLQRRRPTYSELAEIMRDVAAVIVALGLNSDPMIGDKASDYCDLMSKMSRAIDEGDRMALERFTVELQRKPGV
jgi:hypothetical protein